MTMESITPDQEKQVVRFTEDAARAAAREVLEEMSEMLGKDPVQNEVIEKGHELQAALKPVIKETLTDFLAGRTASYKTMKTIILIRTNGKSNPYFDETFKRWYKMWRDLGIKNPNFMGIAPFTAHEGYRSLILPKSDLITPQYLYDRCNERFDCWKWTSGSLDKVMVNENRGRDYVVWFRDRVEADEELMDKSANDLTKLKFPGITLTERELQEYDHFNRTGGHLDIKNITLCSGSRYSDGTMPSVRRSDDRMNVSWDYPGDSSGPLRSRQQFFSF